MAERTVIQQFGMKAVQDITGRGPSGPSATAGSADATPEGRLCTGSPTSSP